MKRLYDCIPLRLALTARLAALAVFGWVGYGATAADLDPTPLGGWPENSFAGPTLVLADGKALVSGTHRGVPSLMAVQTTGANPFKVLGAMPSADTPLALVGPHAIISGPQRLSVVDVTDLSNLRVKGIAAVPFGLVAVSGTHAYVVQNTFSADHPEAPPATITVVDFSDPTNPRIVGEQSFLPRAAKWFSLDAAASDDGLLCVASTGADFESPRKTTLDVFDVHAPAAPRWVGRHETAAEGVHALAVVGRRAYWAPWTFTEASPFRRSKLEVVDLSDPAAPRLKGTYTTTGEATSLAANARYVYLARDVMGDLNRIAVDIVDAGDPTAPKRVGGFTGTTYDAAPTIALEGTFAVVSAMTSLASYDISDPTVMRRLAVQSADYWTSDVTLAGSRAYTLGGDKMNISDVSQPEAPQRLGTYKVANGIQTHEVAIAGNYAYLATDSLGVQTIDVSDPAVPRRTSVFRGDSQFYTVALEGKLMAAAGYDGLFFLDLADPAKPVLRGRASVRYPEFREKSVAISGHHVFVTSSDDRFSKTGVMEVFDASDPASPQYVGAYEVPAVTREVAVSGQLAVVTSYVPDGDTSFAEILDISDPANPIRLALHTVIPGGPDIAKVSLVGNYAILGGPQVLDLTDPTKPRLVAEMSLAGNATLSGDVLFAAAGGKGLRTFRMSPATLSRSRTIGVGGPALGLALQGEVAWIALGTAGLGAVNRTKPDSAAFLGPLPLNGKAWDVALAGNHAVVAAGDAGLVIVDITDPANPQPLGELDTPGYARAVAVSGNTACVADFSEGVQMVDLSNPASPRAISSLKTPGFPLGLAWRGHHVLVACREAGLQVLDLADPSQPKLVGSYLVRGAVEAVTVVGDRAFIADGLEGFIVLDVSEPAHPKLLGLAPAETQARSTAVAGRFAYVADVTRGIRVYDIGDPTHPREVGGSAVNTYRLLAIGDRLLAAAGGSGLAEFEFFAAPLELGILRSGNRVKLTWPTSALGFVLESGNALNSMANWQPEPIAPEIVGEYNVVTLEIGAGPRYFRLRKP